MTRIFKIRMKNSQMCCTFRNWWIFDTYIWIFFLQDFILEHYSEDGSNFDDAIDSFMELRQVQKQIHVKNI